jgi:hypothetical protein
MDNETRAAIEEQINENRVKSPVVTIDIRSRHPETGAAIDERHECEGVIALANEGMTIDEDGDPVLASSTLMVGGFSELAATRIALNLINNLEKHYPGIKKSITTILAHDWIKGAMMNGFAPDEGDE